MEEIKYKGMDDDGRSMVEMLGVLSVIGVLSVTAVYGYRTAMDSHHASETVDRIMKRAVMVSSQRLLGQAADISAFTETGAYEIPNVVDTSTPGKFGLTVNGVPEKVCSKIEAYDWKLPVIMPGECGESNDMKFIFNDDLKDNHDIPTKQTADGWTGDELGAECPGERPGPCSVCLKTYVDGDNTAGGWYDSDALCASDEICKNGECMGIVKTEGKTCYETDEDGYDTIPRECTDADCEQEYGAGWTWNESARACENLNAHCVKNSDCETLEPERCADGACFCKYNYHSWSHPNDTYNSGVCEEKAARLGSFSANSTAPSMGYIKSSISLDAPSAQNFCKAYGKNLAPLSSLNVSVPTTTDCDYYTHNYQEIVRVCNIFRAPFNEIYMVSDTCNGEHRRIYMNCHQWIEYNTTSSALALCR